MFKTSCQMGRHFMKGVSEDHSKVRSFRSVHWLNIIRFLHETSQGFINLGKKVLLGIFVGCELIEWRIFGKEIF